MSNCALTSKIYFSSSLRAVIPRQQQQQKKQILNWPEVLIVSRKNSRPFRNFQFLTIQMAAVIAMQGLSCENKGLSTPGAREPVHW